MATIVFNKGDYIELQLVSRDARQPEVLAATTGVAKTTIDVVAVLTEAGCAVPSMKMAMARDSSCGTTNATIALSVQIPDWYRDVAAALFTKATVKELKSYNFTEGR